MEKIIILSFVLLACVCLIRQGGAAIANSTTPTPTPSVDVNATTPMPTSMPTSETTPSEKSTTAKPKSGAVSVKSFAGLVFSFFVIALL